MVWKWMVEIANHAHKSYTITIALFYGRVDRKSPNIRVRVGARNWKTSEGYRLGTTPQEPAKLLRWNSVLSRSNRTPWFYRCGQFQKIVSIAFLYICEVWHNTCVYSLFYNLRLFVTWETPWFEAYKTLTISNQHLYNLLLRFNMFVAINNVEVLFSVYYPRHGNGFFQ